MCGFGLCTAGKGARAGLERSGWACAGRSDTRAALKTGTDAELLECGPRCGRREARVQQTPTLRVSRTFAFQAGTFLVLLAASRMRMKENPKFASAASVRAKRRRLNSGFRRQMRSAPGLSQQKPRCSQPTTAECAAADLPSRSNGRANRSAASPPAIPPAPANASPQAATFELRVANLARTQVVVFAHLGVPAPLLVQQRPWCAHLAQRNRAVSRCTRLAGPQPNVQLCTQLTQRCLPIGIRSFRHPAWRPTWCRLRNPWSRVTTQVLRRHKP